MNTLSEQAAYLALRPLFHEKHAKIRQPKAVKKRIAEQTQYPEVEALVEKYSIDKVASVAHRLLETEVFEDISKAKQYFPNLLCASPSKTPDKGKQQEVGTPNTSISSATRCPLNPTSGSSGSGHSSSSSSSIGVACGEVIASGISPNDSSSSNDNKDVKPREKSSITSNQPHDPMSSAELEFLPSEEAKSKSVSFRVEVHIVLQHRVLRKVQSVLENSCFQYMQSRAPIMLRDKQWYHAHCVELHTWAKIFSESKNLFASTYKLGKNFFGTIADIRHTAVHRIPVTSETLMHLLMSAQSLCVLLVDATASETIAMLSRKTATVIRNMEMRRKKLEERVSVELQTLQDQRAALCHQERTLMAEMLEEDQRIQLESAEEFEWVMGTEVSDLEDCDGWYDADEDMKAGCGEGMDDCWQFL